MLPGADHQLRGAAADVHHQERPGRRVELADGAGEGQLGLLVAGDDLRVLAERGVHHLGEVAAVGGVPGGRGGDHPGAHRTGGADHRGVVGERAPGAVERVLGQPPGGVDALAEPDHPHLAVHVDQLRSAVPVPGHVGDQQPDGIRAAVDGRDPHGLLGHRSGRRVARSAATGSGSAAAQGRVGHDRTVPQRPARRRGGPGRATDACGQQPGSGPCRSRCGSAADPALQAGLAAAGTALTPALRSLALDAGSAEIIEAVGLADTHPPVLRTHDRAGHRIDEVDYHPAWHTLMARAVAAGLQAAPWAPDADPQAHLHRAAGFYLWTQTESGHLCPISMTYSAVPALRHNPALAAQYEPGLRSRTYDFGLRPAAAKAGLLAGMSMTEKQGGSDLRAGSTVAVPDSAGCRRVPVDRAQMVHLGADERRLPHPRAGAAAA